MMVCNIRKAAISLFLVSGIMTAGVAGISSPARAAIDDFTTRVKSCAKIDKIIARAKCYDETMSDYNLDTLDLAPIKDERGKWKISIEKSPVDDSYGVFSTLNGNDYVLKQNGDQSRPAMVIRCEEGKNKGYVVWDNNLGTKDLPIRIRWGKETALTESWVPSSDSQATFIPNIDSFIAKIPSYDFLFIEVQKPGESPLSSTFDLRGASAMLQAMAESCKAPQQP